MLKGIGMLIKKVMLAFFCTVLSNSAIANDTINISELLRQGYKIVAVIGEGGLFGGFTVFLQKDTQAYFCIGDQRESLCYSLNNHRN